MEVPKDPRMVQRYMYDERRSNLPLAKKKANHTMSTFLILFLLIEVVSKGLLLYSYIMNKSTLLLISIIICVIMVVWDIFIQGAIIIIKWRRDGGFGVLMSKSDAKKFKTDSLNTNKKKR